MPTKIKRYTVAEIEDMYYRVYKPGGSYRYDDRPRPYLLKVRRDVLASLKGARGHRAARLRGELRGVEECLEATKERAKFEKRVTYRQEGGDDGYQYVVRVDGRVRYSGLTRREAQYYKKLFVKQLMS